MSYDELDTLTGLLKQSAIAYMCQGAQGYWSGFASRDLATWQIAGDKTHYKESHNFHTGDDWTDVTVVRPGSSGSVGSYHDVLAGLRKSLEQLNDDVEDQEDRIRRSAVLQLNDIWLNRSNYRLTGGVRGATENEQNSRGGAALYLDEIDDRDEFRVGVSPEIKWDYTIAAGIVAGLEAIAQMLQSSAKDASHTDVTEGVRASVIRDARVGVGGGYGPSQAVQELDEALYDLLDNMAGDWRAGAENLRAASTYFEAVEDGRVAQLATLGQAVDAAAADVQDGTGIKVHDYRNIEWWERMTAES